ncbi:MAG TPA: DciA family protein [Pyrinomonadaceae bacterium]
MEQFIKAMPAILQATSGADEVAQVACIAAWNHVVGEGMRAQTAAIGIENRELIVAVKDHIWQKQLQTMLGQLRFRINAVLGQPLISGIKLRIQPEAISQVRENQRPRRKGENLPEDVRKAAERIQDVDLRQAFLGAAESCLERK